MSSGIEKKRRMLGCSYRQSSGLRMAAAEEGSWLGAQGCFRHNQASVDDKSGGQDIRMRTYWCLFLLLRATYDMIAVSRAVVSIIHRRR